MKCVWFFRKKILPFQKKQYIYNKKNSLDVLKADLITFKLKKHFREIVEEF